MAASKQQDIFAADQHLRRAVRTQWVYIDLGLVMPIMFALAVVLPLLPVLESLWPMLPLLWMERTRVLGAIQVNPLVQSHLMQLLEETITISLAILTMMLYTVMCWLKVHQQRLFIRLSRREVAVADAQKRGALSPVSLAVRSSHVACTSEPSSQISYQARKLSRPLG